MNTSDKGPFKLLLNLPILQCTLHADHICFLIFLLVPVAAHHAIQCETHSIMTDCATLLILTNYSHLKPCMWDFVVSEYTTPRSVAAHHRVRIITANILCYK